MGKRKQTQKGNTLSKPRLTLQNLESTDMKTNLVDSGDGDPSPHP